LECVFVTLVLTVNGPETSWLLADRRLSYKGRSPKDDARKIMFLETTDGVAILGYAGLGATALGTEPADWMSAVLRGRNLPLEQSLGAIADAMKKQFPPHMVRMPVPSHDVIATAFQGKEPRLYTIGLALSPDRKSSAFRYTRLVVDASIARPRTQPVALGGSGGLYLARNTKKWMRSLLRMVKANDRGQLSSLAVADHLAKLNNEVHLGINDKSVGPRCIVAWRHRKGGVHNTGGAQQSFTGTTRDTSSPSIPTISHGMDVAAICTAIGKVMMPVMFKRLEALQAGKPLPEEPNNQAEINAELALLPETPDENLR
jgi:hypothetical protein